jgi:carboxyl-terminal processing protease
MRRVLLVFLTLATGATAFASASDEPLAGRFRTICEAVQAHHVEAPTRQQMFHAGIVAMYHAAEKVPPGGLGERISGLTTYEQFASLLTEVRPKPGGSATTEAALDRAFLDGLSASVPGGLVIMEPKESKVAAQLAGNRYVGIQISVTLDQKSKRPKVMDALEGGPAHRAGMKAGDVIEAVDGKAVGGLTLAEYVDQLRGEEGTTVTVSVRRAGEKTPLIFRMTREAMRHATISGPAGRKGFRFNGAEPAPGAARPDSFRLAGAGPIGYLKIQELLASTPREVREAAAKMEADGLEALVLDLRQMHRGAGSAEIHPAVLLADELLDSGTIGRVRLASREVTYRAEPGALFSGWPIAVLVDGATSDQAEWIAAALKVNKRATIVGTTTAGLGISRSTVPIGEGGRTVNLVTGLLEWPDGRLLGYFVPANFAFPAMGQGMEDYWPRRDERLGVSPDVPVPPAPRNGPSAEDRSLKAALEVLAKAIRRPGIAGPGSEKTVPEIDGRGAR